MVTSAGKIVFVSHSVENILGHPQVSFSYINNNQLLILNLTY